MARTELSLRRMIAELAEMPDGACQAVLSELDETQRDKVRTLLDEYGGHPPSTPRLPLAAGTLPPDLSGWLVDLLTADFDDPGERPRSRATLTTHARNALRACAEELRQTSSGGVELCKPSRWQTLRGRISSLRSPDPAR